jgi:hypothetical protein
MLVALGGCLLSMLVSGIAQHNLFKFTYYLIAALTLVYLREADSRVAAPSAETVERPAQPTPALPV